MTDKRIVAILVMLGVIIISFTLSLFYVNSSLEVTSEMISSLSREQVFVYSNAEKYRGPELGGDFHVVGNIHVKNNAVLSTTYKVPNDWVACAYDRETKTSRDLQFMLSSGKPSFEGSQNELYYDLKPGEDREITMRISPYRYYDSNEDTMKYEEILLVPTEKSYYYGQGMCASVSEKSLETAHRIQITS